VAKSGGEIPQRAGTEAELTTAVGFRFAGPTGLTSLNKTLRFHVDRKERPTVTTQILTPRKHRLHFLSYQFICYDFHVRTVHIPLRFLCLFINGFRNECVMEN
jgi:hypothetical protein